jgi:hypothetical protein
MKPLESKVQRLTLALLLTVVLRALPLPAAPTEHEQPSKANLHQSVFILPTNTKEGRDPFFPNSNRPYEAAEMATTNRTVEVTALVLKGFSGSPEQRLAIINNHTFAAGDEGDVTTAQGRIHVRCIEIRPHSVVVQIGGQYHELTFSDKP